MGSLAAGPDNNSSGYDSEMDELNIKYISQQMCITRRKEKEPGRTQLSHSTLTKWQSQRRRRSGSKET